MYPWHCFPITINKVDLESEELVCIPMFLRIFSLLNGGMELKIASVLSLMTTDDLIIAVK